MRPNLRNLFNDLNQRFKICCSESELQTLTDFLHRGETRRHKRKTQHILYHSHLMEHRLHTGRITVHEQEIEEIGKHVVYLDRKSTRLNSSHL